MLLGTQVCRYLLVSLLSVLSSGTAEQADILLEMETRQTGKSSGSWPLLSTETCNLEGRQEV